MDSNKLVRSALIYLFVFCYPGAVVSGEINTGPSGGNLAILGYDPVAYFTERRAVRGSRDISYNWLGAEWNFSTEKHRQLFSEDPIRYAPQYGGHCADGMAFGVTVKYIDPKAWRIIEGQLYLHYDEASAVHLEETEGELERARANWPAQRAQLLEESGN